MVKRAKLCVLEREAEVENLKLQLRAAHEELKAAREAHSAAVAARNKHKRLEGGEMRHGVDETRSSSSGSSSSSYYSSGSDAAPSL